MTIRDVNLVGAVREEAPQPRGVRKCVTTKSSVRLSRTTGVCAIERQRDRNRRGLPRPLDTSSNSYGFGAAGREIGQTRGCIPPRIYPWRLEERQSTRAFIIARRRVSSISGEA